MFVFIQLYIEKILRRIYKYDIRFLVKKYYKIKINERKILAQIYFCMPEPYKTHVIPSIQNNLLNLWVRVVKFTKHIL